MRLGDDDFALFGLPRRQRLDVAQLDVRRRELQQQVHPDRHAADDAGAQRLAMQWAVRINSAYQRLKDPLARAALLCELAGAPVDAEADTAMPADFLGRQMAWREALDDAATAADVEALDAEVARDEAARLEALARQLDDEHDPAAAGRQLRALMFVARMRQAIERRLDALDTTR